MLSWQTVSVRKRFAVLEARQTISKPDAGNPHVRFERGPQKTELVRHRA